MAEAEKQETRRCRACGSELPAPKCRLCSDTGLVLETKAAQDSLFFVLTACNATPTCAVGRKAGKPKTVSFEFPQGWTPECDVDKKKPDAPTETKDTSAKSDWKLDEPKPEAEEEKPADGESGKADKA